MRSHTRRAVAQGVAGSSLFGVAATALDASAAPPPAKPMRILILGGTGFIGPDQVRYALARGHQVTLFNRGRQPRAWPGQVEELIGDRNTGDLKALEGRAWDVCIDNPTTLPFWVRDAGAVLRGHVGHYIFISTISVYASDAKPADENAALAPYAGKDAMAESAATLKADVGSLYGPLKAMSEQEATRQFGPAVTIIRPGLIVGPGDETDRFTYWPARLADAGPQAARRGEPVLAPGNRADPVQLIDARDLAEWTIRMAETRRVGVYNATGPARTLTMQAFLRTIASAIHVRPDLVWVPSAFLESQKVEAWSDMPVWVPAEGDSAGFARRDIRRALAAGLTFRPLGATAADTLAWFETLPPDRRAHLRAGLTPAREAAVLAAWKSRAPAASG